jgi:cytochrome c
MQGFGDIMPWLVQRLVRPADKFGPLGYVAQQINVKGYFVAKRFVMIGLIGLAASALVAAAPAAPAGNVAAGQTVFKMQCSICHAIVAGKTGLGPSLAGVVGRKPGSLAGFTYSPAMQANKAKWDKATLDKFIANPRGALPGNRMIFMGQNDATKRTDLIAYLATLR